MAPTPKKRSSPQRSAASRRDTRAPRGSAGAALRWEQPISSFAILPLRLFLGITFVYAALQKLTDSGFFHSGSPTYIGAQIQAFSRGSPIQGVLHHLMAYAVPVGILTVATEGSIGLLVLLGLFTRPAALVGLVLNMGFFLSASWGTYPYFFGSDIVFVMCWLTIAITGPGVWALDALVAPRFAHAFETRSSERMTPLVASLLTGWQLEPAPTPAEQPREAAGERDAASTRATRALTRGEALIGSLATLGLVTLGLHPRAHSSPSPTNALGGGKAAQTQATAASPGTGTPTATAPNHAALPSGARKIGNVSQLPPNSAGTVSDPKTGDPAVIVHTSGSSFYAYDAVCTHAGCTVQYDSQQKMLVCPCHGGTFDPAHGAQVVAGPPPSPLTPIKMTIDSHGDIYIV